MQIELLAPAKNREIGTAAIDCGADALYIAGPSFGAREAAGNSFDDIALLADYAHIYGAKVYLALNTILYDSELEAARESLYSAWYAGCDGAIIQDLGILKMELPPIELHASTQCNIRTVDQARFMESLGFKRIVLARELSIAEIAKIHDEVSCELESFVHGALCVSYSGQCYMSCYLSGRSANRGRCIQACRSRYDLKDMDGRVIAEDKALLSLKDLSLHDRIARMADAGVVSFKIEGRLKNISYVRNVVRAYRQAMDDFIASSGGKYSKSSVGRVEGGFTPDISATFTRGYTRYFIDGKRDRWSSMHSAKAVGERIGRVGRLSTSGGVTRMEIEPDRDFKGTLSNGDGLCFVSEKGDVNGVRADVVSGMSVTCKELSSMVCGSEVFRNYNRLFERELENNAPERLIDVEISLLFTDRYDMLVEALSENGGRTRAVISGDPALNKEKALAGIRASFSKRSGIHSFRVVSVEGEHIPFVPISRLNAFRRDMASELTPGVVKRGEFFPVAPLSSVDLSKVRPPERRSFLNCSNHLSEELYRSVGVEASPAYELEPKDDFELMRTKYCIRYELGICPKIKKGEKASPLILVNNGREMLAEFFCSECEMSIRSNKGC